MQIGYTSKFDETKPFGSKYKILALDITLIFELSLFILSKPALNKIQKKVRAIFLFSAKMSFGHFILNSLELIFCHPSTTLNATMTFNVNKLVFEFAILLYKTLKVRFLPDSINHSEPR